MTEEAAAQKVRDFRKAHEGTTGQYVLADSLQELGFLGRLTLEESVPLHNYAISVIEKMGIVTPGEKYQLLLGFSKLLQDFIPKEK